MTRVACELVLRLSIHAKGRASITLTHRSLPLILALVDYSKDPQQQLRAVNAIGNLAQEKFNRYQLACGGVMEELVQLLLHASNDDALKAQCMRAAALIISTNYPSGKRCPLCPFTHHITLPPRGRVCVKACVEELAV